MLRRKIRNLLGINDETCRGCTGPMGPKGDRGESFADYCREWLIKEKKENERIVNTATDEMTFNAFVQHMYSDIYNMVISDIKSKRKDSPEYERKRYSDIVTHINKFSSLITKIMPLMLGESLDENDHLIESLKVVYDEPSRYLVSEIKNSLSLLDDEETRYCNIHDFKKDIARINPEIYDGFINFGAHLKRLRNYFEANGSSVKNTCRYYVVNNYDIRDRNIVSVYENQEHKFIVVEEDPTMTLCVNICMLINSLGMTLIMNMYDEDWQKDIKSSIRQLLKLLYFICFASGEPDEDSIKFLAQIIDDAYADIDNEEIYIYYLSNLFK